MLLSHQSPSNTKLYTPAPPALPLTWPALGLHVCQDRKRKRAEDGAGGRGAKWGGGPSCKYVRFVMYKENMDTQVRVGGQGAGMGTQVRLGGQGVGMGTEARVGGQGVGMGTEARVGGQGVGMGTGEGGGGGAIRKMACRCEGGTGGGGGPGRAGDQFWGGWGGWGG